jgi:TonB family protein
MTVLQVLVALALLAAPGRPAGDVAGDVRDPDGGVIPGATVALSAASMPRRTVITDGAGRFQIGDLAAGEYQIAVTMPGFKTFSRSFPLAEGESVRTTIPLEVGSLTEVINVIAERSRSAPSATPQGSAAWRPAQPAAAPASLPPAVAVAGPVRVGGSIQEPRKTQDRQPVYPALAVSAHVAGIVIVQAKVSADGRVTGARVLRSVPLLDGAVLDALQQWQYSPTRLNGRPIEVDVTVTVNFSRR